MTNKMTYAVAIDFANEVLAKYREEMVELSGADPTCNTALPEVDEVVERLNALKAQLAKRNGSGKKSLTKAQKENVGLKNQIVEVLPVDGMTATEVGNAIGETCQRASALLNQLVKEGLIERVKDGRKTIFRPVAVAEVEEDLGDEEN